MITTLKRKARQYKSAFKAGAIAGKCKQCIIDDQNEEIIPCILHTHQILELAKVNEENS